MTNIYEQFLHTMSTFSVIADIPDTRRSPEQKEQIQHAITDLTENFKPYFDFLSEKFYGMVNDYKFPGDEIMRMLETEELKPPVIESTPSLGILVEKMNKANEAYATVTGLLERYEPALDRFLEEEKRLQRLVRGMTLSDKEWRASGIFEVLHDSTVQAKVRSMGEVVATLKWRKTRIEYAYMVASRMLSANLGDRTGEVAVAEDDRPAWVRKSR